MLSLLQASKQRGDAGKLLPPVWNAFEEKKIRFRKGQLYLVVAAPGCGKSVLAQTYAIYSRAKSLYLSMDADKHTTCVRVVQAVQLMEQEEAEQAVLAGSETAVAALKALEWVKYSFPSGPDVPELVEHVWAYAEAEGDWPDIVWIDNLDNVEADGDEQNSRRLIMADLQKLAHASKCAVVVLHHAGGTYDDAHETIPQSGVLGKVSKYPSMILTMNRGAQDGQLWVSVVKNRFGPADPSGRGVRAELRSDLARMHITDSYIISDQRA